MRTSLPGRFGSSLPQIGSDPHSRTIEGQLPASGNSVRMATLARIRSHNVHSGKIENIDTRKATATLGRLGSINPATIFNGLLFPP